MLASVWARSNLSEDEAMRLAVEETHAARADNRASRGFDTNVLILALISPVGPSAALLLELRAGAFELIVSPTRPH